MMKFIVKHAYNGCRMGVISELVNHPEMELETPLCMLYTKAASAPYLTKDMLGKIEGITKVAQIPLAWCAENVEAIEEYGKGVAQFAAMQGYVVYSSVQDVATAFRSGYNDKNGIGVWGKGGKIKLDVDMFMRVQEMMHVDWAQCLCDSDTDKHSTRKRNKKAIDRTLNFLDKCLEKQEKSEKLKKINLFGVIEGGHMMEERLRSAQETATRPVTGFSLEGFHRGGPECLDDFKLSEIEEIISKVMEVLPDDKPRLMHGVWEPHDVLEAVKLGIDIFDSAYPYLATERGAALIFNFQEPIIGQDHSTSTGRGDNLKENTATVSHISKSYEINLSDKRYFDDLTPILSSCTCYTCKNHTKSYICHLLNTSELLSGVLLMIHNFHHYFSFFTALRTALKKKKVPTVEQLIQSQR